MGSFEKTYASIAPYTVEEAYEVADAIQRGDFDDLKEELGDLLLQVVYHARMAEEDGHFAFDDVVGVICEKMIRRHPHVFGDADQRAKVDMDGLWERVKAEEKQDKGKGKGKGKDKDRTGGETGVLEDVPLALPALTRAVKLQDKAAKVGFDWPHMEPVFAKIREETDELEAAVTIEQPSREKIAEELGDLLFVLANLARHLGVDAEDTLRGANAKFVRRFGQVEARLAEDGRTPSQSTLEEMDGLWDEAKAREKSGGS